VKGVAEMLISGWFETEEGAGFIEVSDVDTVGDLACVLYASYGVEVIGVDIELEGEYTDGTDVSTTMTRLAEELEALIA
jgi:hypothetical protein